MPGQGPDLLPSLHIMADRERPVREVGHQVCPSPTRVVGSLSLTGVQGGWRFPPTLTVRSFQMILLNRSLLSLPWPPDFVVLTWAPIPVRTP